MVEQPVGLAVLGIEGWGVSHADMALRLPDLLRLVCVCDINLTSQARWQERYGVPVYDNLDAVLAHDEVEAVVIPTPNHTHHPLTLQVAEAGRHVLVEKPMANTRAEAVEMIAACDRAGVLLAVGHQTRRGGWCREVKDCIDTGRLGQLVMVEAHSSRSFGLNLPPDSWRCDLQTCPLRPFGLLGIHYLDVFHYLVGRVDRVMAMASTHITDNPAADCVTVLLEFADGPLGMVGGTYVTPGQPYVMVRGTAGAMSWTHDGRLLLYPQGGDMQEIACRESNDLAGIMTSQLANFARAVRGEEDYLVSAGEACDAVAVLDAARHSVATGQRTQVQHFTSPESS